MRVNNFRRIINEFKEKGAERIVIRVRSLCRVSSTVSAKGFWRAAVKTVFRPCVAREGFFMVSREHWTSIAQHFPPVPILLEIIWKVVVQETILR